MGYDNLTALPKLVSFIAGMWILAMMASMEMSQGLMCINSSKQRNPLKARRQAVAKRILVNDG